MRKTDGIRAHDEEAHIYDQQVREYEYFAFDVLFGMCYQYVKPGERLLDLGIGTGLASLPFARAGLEVYGLDGSTEMLNVCESKGFAQDLKCFNLLEMPLPYSRGFFSHVISCGVFHFFGDIGPMVKEVSRIMGSDGTFAFTVAVPSRDTACPHYSVQCRGGRWPRFQLGHRRFFGQTHCGGATAGFPFPLGRWTKPRRRSYTTNAHHRQCVGRPSITAPGS